MCVTLTTQALPVESDDGSKQSVDPEGKCHEKEQYHNTTNPKLQEKRLKIINN